VLQHVAACCNVLQYGAVYCSMLQSVASPVQSVWKSIYTHMNESGVVQDVAVNCSVLQCGSALQRVAAHCSVLQCECVLSRTAHTLINRLYHTY